MARPRLDEQERWGSGCGWRRSCGLNQSILSSRYTRVDVGSAAIPSIWTHVSEHRRR